MSCKFKLIEEIDGRVTNCVVFSKEELCLVMSGIYYAKIKDYHKPRQKNYDKVYRKIFGIVNGVSR